MNDKEYNIFLKGKLYYDTEEYDKALEIFENLYDNLTTESNVVSFFYAKTLVKTHKNFLLAEHLLKSLITFSKRKNAIFELGKLEKERGNYLESRRYFYGLLNTSSRYYVLYELLLIDLKIDNINEAYKFLNELLSMEKDETRKYRLKNIEIYLKNKLGILEEKDLNNSYYAKQVVNYDDTLALDHIEYFYKQFDIESNYSINEIFNIVKSNLNENTFIKSSDVDKYLIVFDRPIFKCNNEDIYALEVSLVINTDNILTITPRNNYIIDKSKEKVKVKSK